MSVTTAELRINATQATQTLNKVQKQIEGLGAGFLKLRNVLSGLALGNFVRNALQLADSIDDVAKATGLATATVIGFGQAIAQNGGTIADAQTALTKLSQTISEAQNGNQNAITSFNELGISLTDLASLSDEEILEKVIKQLGQLKDKGDQARLATDLLGKSAKGIDFSGVSTDLQPAIQNSEEYARSNKAAADASDNLQRIQQRLTQELIKVLEPISNFIKEIDANSEAFARLTNAVLTFIGVLGGLFLLGRAISLLVRFAGAVKTAGEALSKLKFRDIIKPGTGEIIFKEIKVLENKMKDIAKARKGMFEPGAMQKAEHEMGQLKRLQTVLEETKKFFAGVAAGALAAASAVGVYFGVDVNKERKRTGATGTWEGPDPVKPEDPETMAKMTKEFEDQKNKIDAYTKSLNKELLAISQTIDYQKQAIQNGEKLTQVKEIERQVTEKIADAQERYREMLVGLDPANENQKKLIDYINGQIAAIKRKEAATKAAAITAVQDLQKEQEAYQEITRQIDEYRRLQENNAALQNMRDELSLIGLIGEEREKEAERLKIAADLRAKLATLLAEEIELHTRYNQLTEEGRAAEKSSYEKSLADIKKRRNEAEQAAKDETDINEKKWQKIGEIQNNGLKGFQDRLKQLKETLTNYDIGAAFADSIMRAIETGKFHLKTFLLEMIQMWIQQKAKLAAIDLFDKFLSPVIGAAGGAIGKIIGSIFGLAEGGPAMANKPYIVGEKGPELFVPNSSGRVVPNNQLGNGGPVNAPITNNYITNNINAVDAKSVAQLFTENRKTLLGATMMAQKEMPYAGRM